jgi:hypothetical protein
VAIYGGFAGDEQTLEERDVAGNNGLQLDDPLELTEVDHCDVQGGWSEGAGNINADPLFLQAPPVNTDLRLQGSSPCINVGSTDLSLIPQDEFDLDGDM